MSDSVCWKQAKREAAGNAGCDKCGVYDRAPGHKICQTCLNETLAKFGAAVLGIMERETDWSADTMEQIMFEAFACDLARESKGLFKSKVAQ